MTTQVTFQYPTVTARGGALPPVRVLAEAIRSACRAGASLSLLLPKLPRVPCIDGDFRTWAESLHRTVDGLEFIVLTPGSPLIREILFGLMPNLEAAENVSGSVMVRFDALEAQQVLHRIFCSLEEQGLPEDTVIAAMTQLSLACGMTEQTWD